MYVNWYFILYVETLNQVYTFIHHKSTIPRKLHNFCFIGKYTWKKLLYSLASLCKETPLQPLWLSSTFPHTPVQFSFVQTSQLPFLIFCGQYNKGTSAAPISVLLYPTRLILIHRASPTINPLNTAKVISPLRHTICIAACLWREVSLAFCEIVSLCTHNFLPSICMHPKMVTPPPQVIGVPDEILFRFESLMYCDWNIFFHNDSAVPDSPPIIRDHGQPYHPT